MLNALLNFLNEKDVEYKVRPRMAEISPVGIGACAMLYALPSTNKKLVELIEFANLYSIGYIVVGGMSNILPQDDDYPGLIISTKKVNKITFDQNTVKAEAGVYLPQLILAARKRSLGGAEALFGIPGTLGGALVSNAGAFGKSISDFFISADCYDPETKEMITLFPEQLDFKYRSSSVKKSGLVVLDVCLRLESLPEHIIDSEIARFCDIRKQAQPIGERSLGSVFKRHCGVGAGYYIDKCGLKGASCGGAEISKKHAGFIVNRGNATARDYLDLINRAKESVKEKFGIELDLEIEIMSNLDKK